MKMLSKFFRWKESFLAVLPVSAIIAGSPCINRCTSPYLYSMYLCTSPYLYSMYLYSIAWVFLFLSDQWSNNEGSWQ